jgi:hypothetical protein
MTGDASHRLGMPHRVRDTSGKSEIPHRLNLLFSVLLNLLATNPA